MMLRSHWILVVAAATLAACANIKPLTLSDAPSGQAVDLQRNQELAVSLEANPSTGYRWEIVLAAPAVLDRVGDEKFAPASNAGGAVGLSGTTTWHFRAARSGADLLRLAYRRPWEKNVPAAKSVVYTINVR